MPLPTYSIEAAVAYVIKKPLPRSKQKHWKYPVRKAVLKKRASATADTAEARGLHVGSFLAKSHLQLSFDLGTSRTQTGQSLLDPIPTYRHQNEPLKYQAKTFQSAINYLKTVSIWTVFHTYGMFQCLISSFV